MKLLAALLLVPCFASVQPPNSFDVATIKPHSNESRTGAQIQGERFLFGAGVLLSLIEYAYDLDGFQIIGSPQWAGQEMFDIQASAGNGAQLTEAPAKEMLRSLLAERFGLRMHRDTRELDVLRLVSNGTPKLIPAERKSAGFLMSRDGAETKGASMPELARMLQRFGDRGRP